MRHTGIPIIGDVPWGTHFCQFYQDKRDLIDILIPYFKAGLENNEFCMWVTSEPLGVQEAKAALANLVDDLEGYIRKGQIEFLDYGESYTPGGKFESDRVLKGWVERLDSALARGFDGLRLTGNTLWLEKSDWQSFTEYEASVNGVIGHYPMLAICTYSLAKCGALEIINVVSNHSFALIKRAGIWEIVESAERKKIEASLRESEIRFRALADGCPTLIWVTDAQGGARFVNRAYREYFGVTYEQVEGTKWQPLIHPEDTAGYVGGFMRALQDRAPFRAETRLRRGDGEWRWFESYAEPRFSPSGEFLGYAGISTDITDRKQVEEALRRSEKIYRAIGESIDYGVWICAPDGRNTYASESFLKLVGLTQEQCSDFGWGAVLHPDDAEKTITAWKDCVRTEGRWDIEHRFLGIDGQWHSILARGVPVRDEQGRITCWVGINLDISALKRSQESLRESEAQFRTLANAIPQLCWMANADGWIFWYNQRWYEYTGTTPEQMEGWGWQSVHDPEALPKVLECWRGSIATGKPFDMVFPLRGADGVFRPFLTRVMPVFGRDGKVARWFGTNTDISEQRKTQEALRETEERFRALVTASSDVVYRMSPDWSEMSYLHGRDFIADTGKSSATWLQKYIPPDDQPRVMAAINEAIRTKSVFELEYRVIRVDGSFGWTFSRAIPIQDANGEILEWFGTASDVTRRKEAVDALGVSESRFRALFESASQGVVAVDESGRIILVNAKTEEMFGYTRGHLLGQPLDILLPERYRDAHAEHLRHYFAHPRSRAMGLGLELHGLTKDGSQFPLEVSLSCIEQGGSRLAMALITDVTERKKAEERLWQAQKLESIGLLAGGVAHDFNNLLVGVMGNASLAREMLDPRHDAVELLDGVIKTGEQLAHLTRQMLAYSGKGRFLLEPFDLSDLIPEMIGLVQPSIPKKIAIHLDLEPHLPLVEADRGQMQQVFMNLVINASEAIGTNAGVISVKTGIQDVDEGYIRRNPEATDIHPGKYVILEVRDTGRGIDPATKTRIFDPFFSTKFTGRGLGLAAVAGIVRSHKGAIKVSSAPGEGTSFAVLFPALQGEITAPSRSGRRTALHGTGTVLVVDDEQAVRNLAKKALERYGYKVLVAHSGSSAIDILKRHPGDISLIILDLSMPEMGGDEALPELRKVRPEVKIMVSSGYTESETMRLFRGQLVSGFVQKPYTITALAEKVKGILG